MAKRVVLAIFPDEAAADGAAESLKRTGLAGGDAIGILALDESGKVKVEKVGSHSAGKGAGIGLLLALLGPVGIVGGTVGGGLLGLLHHKGLGLSEADRDRIGAEIWDGKAAVGVLTDEENAGPVGAQLASDGGVPEVHGATDEALQEAATTAGTTA
jgi:hypothetical protein